jgi:hypothetical protein
VNLTIEPVPAFDSLLFTLRSAKIEDASVAEQIASLDARKKQTKSSDGAGWAAIYRDTLDLIPRVLEAHRQKEKQQQQAASQQALRQQLGALAPQVPQQLQKSLNDWSGRLQQQGQQLREKADRAIQKLDLAAVESQETGETIFQIDPLQLDGYQTWLANAEETWRRNNGELVAERGNQLLEHLALPEGARFRVNPAALTTAATPLPRLKGFKILTPGKIEALGTTQKIITAALGGVTVLSMAATRIFGNQATPVLSGLLGVVFVGSLAYAAATVPTKHKQAMARQKEAARERVHAELLAATRAHLDENAAAQLIAIKKHLQAEEQRWSQLVRDLGGGSLPGLGGLGPMPSLGGLTPQDLSRLQGEWHDAIAARLAQLTGA